MIFGAVAVALDGDAVGDAIVPLVDIVVVDDIPRLLEGEDNNSTSVSDATRQVPPIVLLLLMLLLLLLFGERLSL